jgi:hypothetical protein
MKLRINWQKSKGNIFKKRTRISMKELKELKSTKWALLEQASTRVVASFKSKELSRTMTTQEEVTMETSKMTMERMAKECLKTMMMER